MMGQPLVTVYDPLTWNHGWNYETEAAILNGAGVDFRVPADASERDDLVEMADLVISSSLIDIDEQLISSFRRCVAILCYSSGMDAVDVAAARKAGIAVGNVQANTAEVAEHAMALLLALTRRIVPMTRATEEGTWDLRTLPEVWEIPNLAGSTAGIIGPGSVGKAVAERCRAFGMRTIATFHNAPVEADDKLEHHDLTDLLKASDFIVVCASLNADSTKMLNSETLGAVKPGAMLVNVGRGPLIDEPALAEALDTGRIAGAALDVRDPEPPGPNDLLANRSNVIQTPHMAGASSSVKGRLQEMAAFKVIELLEMSGRLMPRQS